MKTFLNLFKKPGKPSSQNIEMLPLSDFNPSVPLELSTSQYDLIYKTPILHNFKYEHPSFQLNLSTDYLSSLKLKPIKLLKIRIKLNLNSMLANSAFQELPENKKQEPISRFWPKPQSLKERAIQSIAEQEIRTGSPFPDSNLLPTELRSLIDERLNDFTSGARREKIEAFLVSLNSIAPSPLHHLALTLTN
jgi:hypothetical protein